MSSFLSDLGAIHIRSLEGLGASYRIRGYFELRWDGSSKKINFKGVAFGGHYGGHNVNIEISPTVVKGLLQKSSKFKSRDDIDKLLSEVQRRILNGEMIVEFDRLKQDGNTSPLNNISS